MRIITSSKSKPIYNTFEEDSKGSPIFKPDSKNKNLQVCIEGYEDEDDEEEKDVLCRKKSLTDDDLDELKACLDLGFGFKYDEIHRLCNTLPALELCYSMNQKKYIHDQLQQQQKSSHSSSFSSSTSPISNWKISSPGDDPADVKARLKFWAQTVACTVKLCTLS